MQDLSTPEIYMGLEMAQSDDCLPISGRSWGRGSVNANNAVHASV